MPPFNDLESVERILVENPGKVAGLILEPIMMAAGIIAPEEGYLAGLKELLHSHGALLSFDEVKTGLATHPGGATRRFGVTPDIVCRPMRVVSMLALVSAGSSSNCHSTVGRSVAKVLLGVSR